MYDQSLLTPKLRIMLMGSLETCHWPINISVWADCVPLGEPSREGKKTFQGRADNLLAAIPPSVECSIACVTCFSRSYQLFKTLGNVPEIASW